MCGQKAVNNANIYKFNGIHPIGRMASDFLQQLEAQRSVAFNHMKTAQLELMHSLGTGPSVMYEKAERAYNAATTAQTLYQQVREEAQGLVGKVRMPEHAGIENLIHLAMREISASFVLQAQAKSVAGHAHFNPSPNNPSSLLMDETSRSNMQICVEKCQEGYNSFTAFNKAFRTSAERQNLQIWLTVLFQRWTDAHMLLGSYARIQGDRIIEEAAEGNVNHITSGNLDNEKALQGLEVWDYALSCYQSVIGLRRKAQQAGLEIDMVQYNMARRKRAEVSSLAVTVATAIGRKDLAKQYLRH